MQENENILRLSIAQYDLVWENKNANLEKIHQFIKSLEGQSDLIVLPEMCTTGFSFNADKLAETNEENTITKLRAWSREYDIAIYGSHIAQENNQFYNRGFFITPEQEYFYDKKHLFRMGKESEVYTSGNKRVIVEYKGWNVCLQICYDLRFPVWARNVDNEYDLLLYSANWPEVRVDVWNTLLKARAIENQSYVCGVNRIGRDGMKLDYNGASKVFDAKGVEILYSELNKEAVLTVNINKEIQEEFRSKFPAWKDGDRFDLK